MGIKGFKAMDADMKCRGFQFKVGKTYETDSVSMCSSGFHFCENAFDVYNYYPKTADTIVCEIEAVGDVQKEGDKSATNKIKIIKQLSEKELLALWINRTNSGDYNSGDYNSGDYNSGHYNSGNRNSGHYNSGNRNSGNRNSGNRNSGDYNSGDYNSGHYNSGNRNSGDYNSGNRNSGDYNSGNRNSGDYNSGDYNSGHYNSGNRNSGFFNTETAKVKLFNKECDLAWDDSKLINLSYINVKPILQWVPESTMTDKEKVDHPSAKTTGGYLKNTGRLDWSGLTEADKTLIQSLPGFDAEIFKTISGVDLDTVEVIVNGQKKTISKAKAKELGLVE